MKKIGLLIGLIFLINVLLVSEPINQEDQRWSGNRVWGAEGTFQRMYNPSTVEIIKAEVIKVNKFTPTKGATFGIHLIVKTEIEKISVHLGPGWFMENQNIKIEPKDKIEIRGSRIIFEGKPAIIAAEVRKGENFLKLRDEGGFPVWSGWRRSW